MAGELQIKAKLSRAGAKAWAELGNIHLFFLNSGYFWVVITILLILDFDFQKNVKTLIKKISTVTTSWHNSFKQFVIEIQRLGY